MAFASTMIPPGRSPRRPPPPPPPPRGSKQKKPHAPPRRVPPPPPPPPKKDSLPVSKASGDKRSASAMESDAVGALVRKGPSVVPSWVALRDVEAFEKREEVGQGTYGIVFVARDRKNDNFVALKQVNTKQEANGFPMTALREVKILKALNHENIVTLKEMVTSKGNGAVPKNVFMVFDYFEYDLYGILETPQIRYTADHIKSWSNQLLSGMHYSHTNRVIHRDLKPSNLLVNKRGVLKIADWGLARSITDDMKALTNPVITLWYRPPELLLAKGRVKYSTEIDMWSVGCIIAEMIRRADFLRGTSEQSQTNIIFDVCGHPTAEDWPELSDPKTVMLSYPLWKDYKPSFSNPARPNRLQAALGYGVKNPDWMTEKAVTLLTNLLALNPNKRWSAQEALLSDYIMEGTKAVEDLSMDFSIKNCHELKAKARNDRERRAKRGMVN